MSDRLTINAEGLTAEAEGYGASARTVMDVNREITAATTNASSYQQFVQVFENFKELVREFSDLSHQDANSLLLFKEEWSRLDQSTADQIMQGLY